ncbi:hypothetical protein K2173_002847 [Erythroxylum novogranatense]|uniref:Man1/Src1-like C-terminal domain-containing protein n=1 Tax=Erythroxylum novogranatense TaxID=1862640 RepID=A0AAV8SQV5_9ROSI|nr:hypothetical protein K2173_002847 [Erythroxylum novogranatense]
MSSTLKKRLKPGFRRPQSQPDGSPSYSSMMEPPQNLFPTKDGFFPLLAVVAIASSVAFTCHLIAGYMYPSTMPFCDTHSDSLDSISEFCEPCPRNGECYQGKLECSQGYRKHGNICIEDGDIDERAKKLSEWVEDHICESYSQFLCYGKGTVWVPEKEIWNALGGHELMQNFGSDSWIYLLTKKKVTETIGRLMELKLNSLGNKELKCPDSLGEHYKPLTCHIRQWISKHAFIALLFCSMVLGSIVLLFKIQRRRNLSARVEQLYQQVCEILEESALISKTKRGECESWEVASRLRDHLLSPKERKDPVLWKKVENLVQEDSRIDQYPKLVKGESKVVWEWQGMSCDAVYLIGQRRDVKYAVADFMM